MRIGLACEALVCGPPEKPIHVTMLTDDHGSSSLSGTVFQFHDEPHVSTHHLPRDNGHLLMPERIAHAAARIVGDVDDQQREWTSPSYDLRSDQSRVFRDFASFLQKVTRGLAQPWGRIILPPRTGKTIIAGHILARSGLHATFIVPTKTLVMQTAREFRALWPNVPVGLYFGEQKELVTEGVNITTYSILLRDYERGRLPRALASAALIFADEAHHVMTERRMNLLQHGFARGAVRVALTATPDYDDERRVCFCRRNCRLCLFYRWSCSGVRAKNTNAVNSLAHPTLLPQVEQMSSDSIKYPLPGFSSNDGSCCRRASQLPSSTRKTWTTFARCLRRIMFSIRMRRVVFDNFAQ